MSEPVVVLSNFPDEANARGLARKLVASGLAACQSVYRREGAVEEATVVPLLIKTTSARHAAVQQAIRDSHPFGVPEIIALPVAQGLPAYLAWVLQETAQS